MYLSLKYRSLSKKILLIAIIISLINVAAGIKSGKTIDPIRSLISIILNRSEIEEATSNLSPIGIVHAVMRCENKFSYIDLLGEVYNFRNKNLDYVISHKMKNHTESLNYELMKTFESRGIIYKNINNQKINSTYVNYIDNNEVIQLYELNANGNILGYSIIGKYKNRTILSVSRNSKLSSIWSTGCAK